MYDVYCAYEIQPRVTGACPVTTDLIMRVNVRTTTTTTYKVLDLHVNSVIAIYVWRLPLSRSAPNDGCIAQTNPPDPRPDPNPNANPNPNPNPDPNLIPNPNPTLRGARGLLSRSAGAVLSLRAIILKTLHVRAIKRLVVSHLKPSMHVC